jgi:Zn-dependent protease
MPDPAQILMYLFALIIAIPIHEYAHARSAVSYGDDTPARDGRLTIYPWTHFEPIGTLFILMSLFTGFGLGWGRPVMVRPENFRHPRIDDVKCAAWGPFSNLLLAIGFALLIRSGYFPDLFNLLYVCLMVNLGLMCFNLIPIYPLDGSHIVRGLLPAELSQSYHRFMMQWGMVILLLLLFMGRDLLSLMIEVPRSRIASLLLGW